MSVYSFERSRAPPELALHDLITMRFNGIMVSFEY